MEEKKDTELQKNSLEENQNKTEDKECKSGKFWVFLTVLFFLSSALLGWLYIQSRNEVKVVYVELDKTKNEKASIKKELENMLNQYNDLKTNNEQLNAQIEEQKAKIQQLLQDLDKTKKASYWEIHKYKKELETLRKILKSYVHQVDSLNTLNQKLMKENQIVKTNFEKVKGEKENLENIKKELETKVDIAKTLRAINFNVSGLNKKGKPNNRAKKVKKIQVCFTISENKVVEPGNKIVYLRIARPDGSIITSSEYNLFEYQGNKIAYTAKREIEYNNKDTNVCIYWTNEPDEKLMKGTYYADIFIDGKNVGTTTFKLR
jgi:hypothetical protein